MINYANWAREFKKRQKTIHTIMDKPLRELHDLTNRKCGILRLDKPSS